MFLFNLPHVLDNQYSQLYRYMNGCHIIPELWTSPHFKVNMFATYSYVKMNTYVYMCTHMYVTKKNHKWWEWNFWAIVLQLLSLLEWYKLMFGIWETEDFEQRNWDSSCIPQKQILRPDWILTHKIPFPCTTTLVQLNPGEGWIVK